MFFRTFLLFLIILKFLLIFPSETTFAQKIKFEHITGKQGLSQSSVTCIVQDQIGFMWFCTYDGITRYDGYNFKVFKNSPSDSNSLSYNFARTVLVDNSNRLWIGTMGGGLNLFDRYEEKFIRYQYNPEDPNSISHNGIFTIIQDHSGTVWIGTWGGGLNKAVPVKQSIQRSEQTLKDSLIFVHFRNDPGNSNSLTDDKISSIYEDVSGLLWVGTRHGISIFDPVQNQFIRHYNHDPQDYNSLSSDNITSICGDHSGNIWIGTWDQGLNMFDQDQNRFFRYLHDPNDIKSISHNTIMRLYTDRSGNLWIGTWGGGLNKLLSSEITVKRKERKQYFIRYQHYNNDIHSIIGNSIYSIFEDRSGVLWIGTDWNGLSRYDQDKAKFAHYQSDPNMPNQLNDNTIQSIYKDEYDNLWIGTSSGGLNMYNKKTDQYVHYLHNPHDPHSLSHNTVRTVYKDRSGNLWIGTETGLNQYDRKKERFIRYFSDPDDPSTTNITSICEDHDGYLWLGNWGKGLCRFDPAKKTFKTYQHDANDPNSISDNIIYCITEDQQGRLWIGTEHGGLNRFDKKSNRFIHYMYDEKDTTSLSDNKVLTLMQSASGDIWVGTTAGLNRMIHNDDPEAIPVFKHYTVADGLSSNTIQGILEDDHGNLWICNGDYLVTLNPKTETFRSYDVYDRLQGGEFSLNAVFKDKDTGEMYLGGVNGFNIFHPDSIKDNPVAPNIAITNFKLSNKSIQPGGIVDKRIILEKSITVTDKIILSHTDDVISFEFAALHFNSPENNKYAFMLENFEKMWNYVGNKREATYTNLDPGEYIFRVKASNHDGVWNEEGTSIKIIVTPPFWQTWWFRILMITITISLIYLIYKIRVRNIETHRRELEITVKKRTQQLVEKTEALEVSKKETDNILHNVEEGFFLLDREYKISSQYSSALETIFSTKEIAHLNLLDFCSDKITESDIENTRMYLEFLFDEKVNENSIQHLNPLVDLEFTFSKGNYLKKEDNSKISKYLNFSFKRIKSDGNKIAELIVTVRDVTRSILLAKQLKEEEARRERLLQLMLGILDVEPEMLNDFNESAQRELAFIDKIINHSEIEEYQALLVKVFRATHLIKGNAKLLNIDYFAQAAHQFEDMIAEVQKKTQITERDIDPLKEKVRELETGIEEMERIIERMGQIHTQKGSKKGIDTGTLLQSLENLINSFSSDLGKKIKFNYKRFNGHIIPVKYHLLVKEVLIQLIRNAISHGIEFPEERKRLKKPKYGKIEISTFKKNGSIGFRLRDDGRGIQIKKLKEKAFQSGRWDKEEIEQWDDNKIAELIFTSGISTAERVDMIAGRGVGMDGVIHRLKEYRGEIQVHFTEGQYCEFEVILPAAV